MTAGLMASQGVVTLFQNPNQLAELKANPGLAPAFVEELCRYHTGSAMAMKRVAKEDVKIGGKVSFAFPNMLSPITADIEPVSAPTGPSIPEFADIGASRVSKPARASSRRTSPPTEMRRSSPIRTSSTCIGNGARKTHSDSDSVTTAALRNISRKRSWRRSSVSVITTSKPVPVHIKRPFTDYRISHPVPEDAKSEGRSAYGKDQLHATEWGRGYQGSPRNVVIVNAFNRVGWLIRLDN